MKDCLNPIPTRFIFIYYFLLSLLSLGVSGSISKYIFKSITGLILFSLGIVWDGTLNSISILNDIANSIIEFTENHSNIKIPRKEVVDSTSTMVLENINLDTDSSGYSWLTVIGIGILGISGIIAGLLITEHYSPETIQNIPVVNTFVDLLHISWDTIQSYLFSSDTGSSPDPKVPESISRSSSGSSSVVQYNPMRHLHLMLQVIELRFLVCKHLHLHLIPLIFPSLQLGITINNLNFNFS